MELLERPETNFALRAVPAFSKRSSGGSSKRATEATSSREIAELEGRGYAKPVAVAGVTAAVAGVVGYGIYRAVKGQVDYENAQQGRDVS